MNTDFEIKLNSVHLSHGSHNSPDEGMCIMEAVAWLTGEDFNDAPECVSAPIRAYCIALNDFLADELRQRLKSYILKLIGTAGNPDADIRRALIAADAAVRVFAPLTLDGAGLSEQAAALRGLPPVTDVQAADAAADAAAATARAADRVADAAADAAAATARAAARVADAAAATAAAARVARAAATARVARVARADAAAARTDVIEEAFALLERLITA